MMEKPSEGVYLALPPWENHVVLSKSIANTRDFGSVCYGYDDEQDGGVHVAQIMAEILSTLGIEETFFTTTVPYMKKMVSRCLEWFPKSQVPLLVAEGSLVLSKQAVACLCSMMFLGLFDRHRPVYPAGGSFNVFTLSGLFRRGMIAPLTCITHYLERMSRGVSCNDDIVLKRFSLPREWEMDRSRPLCPVVVHVDVAIEKSPAELHADFANEYPGGGSLTGGCVQEEILFVIKPECLVSMLLIEKLEASDSFVIEGAEQFSTYSGYGRTWKFSGDFVDERAVKPTIIGIDASVNRFGLTAQFERPLFIRDIRKCVAGIFKYPNCSFATGNWGCGAFGGDKHLKALQQLLACSSCDGMTLIYCTFGDKDLAKALERFVEHFKNATLGHLLEIYDGVSKGYVAKETLLVEMIKFNSV